jgi:DHA1 family bicyclomycin/chloramphenicol resistance-like MFS transporter
MNPNASTLWRGKRWQLALLLACLGMLGPFSIDTYLPAFAGIARSVGATPVQMQQTLSSYLLGFGVMNLFHGALSDSLGRRPVVLAGVAVFTLASVGCALSQSIGQLVFWRAVQGMSAGAGMVVSRAIIRDMFAPADAQRVMSQVTIYFGIAPAVAPLVGGFLFVHADWHAIFWLLVLLGAALWLAMLALAARDAACRGTPALRGRQPAARLCAPAAQPALRGAGVCQRRALQRHVPVRAVGTGVAG